MEKKNLLGVRKKLPTAAAAAAKRRRKVVTPAKAGAGGLAKVIAAYLASDSYMYAPLVSAPPAHPPPPQAAPSAAPPVSTPVAKQKLAPKPNRGKAAKNRANLLNATIVPCLSLGVIIEEAEQWIAAGYKYSIAGGNFCCCTSTGVFCGPS